MTDNSIKNVMECMRYCPFHLDSEESPSGLCGVFVDVLNDLDNYTVAPIGKPCQSYLTGNEIVMVRVGLEKKASG